MSKEQANPIKYSCFQPEVRNSILDRCQDEVIKNHLNDLYDLISYQLHQINQYSAKIIAINHTQAWKHYDDKKCSNHSSCSKKCKES